MYDASSYCSCLPVFVSRRERNRNLDENELESLPPGFLDTAASLTSLWVTWTSLALLFPASPYYFTGNVGHFHVAWSPVYELRAGKDKRVPSSWSILISAEALKRLKE